MSSFTLDDIRAAAEKSYGNVDIELSDGTVCTLVNPLRLPKAKRDRLTSLQDAEGVDTQEVLEDTIRIVAQSPARAEQLIEEVGGDLAVLAQLTKTYSEGVELGEASASRD